MSIKFLNLFFIFILFNLLSMSEIQKELLIQYTDVPPKIDGKIEESEWMHASIIDRLQPCINGNYQDKINIVPTEIKLLWNEKYLFVSFHCVDPNIFSPESLNRDDNLYKWDVIEVFIDGFGDSKQWIEIQVSPNNQILDLNFVLAAKPECSNNKILSKAVMQHLFCFREWNCEGLLTATGRIERDGKPIGWTVEMVIPAKIILKRYNREKFEESDQIRANFLRYDYQQSQKNADLELIHMNWIPVMHGCPHISPCAMGYLKLLKNQKLLEEGNE